jgi:hypothetical protein
MVVIMIRKLSLFLSVFLLFSISITLVDAELFTPTLDGAKAATEYTSANSKQVTFTDHSTNKSETGTVFVGRNTSHLHYALEMLYPAGDAEGYLGFTVTYGEKTPHLEQILDRKVVVYAYNVTTQSWYSDAFDQNQKQDTNDVQNETANDVFGVGGRSETKVFLEMTIPLVQTDSEPYDRHLEVDQEVQIRLGFFRVFYNATHNTDWEFNSLSDTYAITVLADEVTISLVTTVEDTPAFGFYMLVVSLLVILLQNRAKKDDR